MSIKNCNLTDNILPHDGEVFYLPNFFSAEVSEKHFKALLCEVEWRQEAIRIFGKPVLQPRRTAWYGDKDYSYSSIVMKAHPWTDCLNEIKTRVEEVAQQTFNGVLLNHYRDGQDSMGWHRDNEKELGHQPVIASVSFGQPRRFLLRHRGNSSTKIELILENGSLLIMKGQSQHDWEHSLPKTTVAKKARINLTFRQIKSV